MGKQVSHDCLSNVCLVTESETTLSAMKRVLPAPCGARSGFLGSDAAVGTEKWVAFAHCRPPEASLGEQAGRSLVHWQLRKLDFSRCSRKKDIGWCKSPWVALHPPAFCSSAETHHLSERQAGGVLCALQGSWAPCRLLLFCVPVYSVTGVPIFLLCPPPPRPAPLPQSIPTLLSMAMGHSSMNFD